MNKTFSILMMSSWILGLILIIISNPSLIISKIKTSEIICDKPHYGFKHIRKAISLTSDKKIIERLNRKILIRKIGFSFLILTPIFFILGGIFGQR
ncbi:hypothetical protein [uncultured Tenacibaculum sp.]|uniref:hypothetical protein n=1 Tax=uncultured Tenacibaculum sp. TaxID=174713 RepID=UPI00262267F3|nr:hypothetical protein [uncultured Tenacibaculum sp.]